MDKTKRSFKPARSALRVAGGLPSPDCGPVVATYRLRASEQDARKLALALCYEHTIELSPELVGPGYLEDHVVARIGRLTATSPDECLCEINYPANDGKGGLTTLLTLVMGNAGFFPQVELVDLNIPECLRRQTPGPRYGTALIRELLNRPTGPLAGTALKPLGASVRELALIAREMAQGGIEILKEDDGISTQPFAPFAERVAACADQVREGAVQNGTTCLYFPNISGPIETLAERALFAQESGAGGVEVLPGLMGFDAVRMLADLPEFTLPIAVHSAWLGGMCRPHNPALSYGVAFGLLPRLAGADISIMPGFGGRFGLLKKDCISIAQNLRKQPPTMPASLPMPGGGVTIDRIEEFVSVYGPDVIILISGALFSGPDSLVENCRKFAAEVKRHDCGS